MHIRQRGPLDRSTGTQLPYSGCNSLVSTLPDRPLDVTMYRVMNLDSDFANDVSLRRRGKFRSVDEYLEHVQWQAACDQEKKSRIKTALDFFQEIIPIEVLFKEIDDPGPWMLPLAKPVRRPEILSREECDKLNNERLFKPIKLTEFILSFNYDEDVERISLGTTVKLKAFKTFEDSKSNKFGCYFAGMETKGPDGLAIEDKADKEIVYQVIKPTWALKGKIADNYVDWASQRRDPKYKKGKTSQYFIWEAGRYLRKI